MTEVIARCGTSVALKRCSLGVCRVRNYSAMFLSLPVYLLHRPTYSMPLLVFSLPLSLALLLSPSARQKIPPTPFAGRVTGSLDHASCTARTEGVSQPRYHHTSSTTKPPVNDNRKTMIINDSNDVDEAEDNDNDTIAA